MNEPADFDSDDSIKDPDYQPETYELSETDEGCIVSNIKKHTKHFSEKDEGHEYENSENTTDGQQRQFGNPELGASVQKKRTRKERQINKELRNKGQSYVSEKGKKIKARKMLPLKPCRMKCLERFLEENRQKCFDDYWAIGDHDNWVKFISALIAINKPKTHRVVVDSSRLRDMVCKYSILIEGNNQPVCRECFRRTFGETTGFIERVAKKKGILFWSNCFRWKRQIFSREQNIRRRITD